MITPNDIHRLHFPEIGSRVIEDGAELALLRDLICLPMAELYGGHRGILGVLVFILIFWI